MEETLGKRIVFHRKKLGMTQDRLAEALGVTAQAVSKWENDQSCPDISTLPRLARILGVSTDTLLGMESPQPPVSEESFEPDYPPEDAEDLWEIQWDSSRKSGIGFALWVLLAGSLLLSSNIWHWNADFFHLLWSSGLMLFGLLGLYPKFSVLRLGCALFGGYFLYSEIFPISVNRGILLPVYLLLFGLSLLVEALRKPKQGSFHVMHSGKPLVNKCSYENDCFLCSTSFGHNEYLIQLPRLSGGKAEVSFGSMTVDLQQCEILRENCRIDLECSFGQLQLLVPRRFRVEPDNDTTFGSVEITGNPDETAVGILHVDCDVSFGRISLIYI